LYLIVNQLREEASADDDWPFRGHDHKVIPGII
jgi:hypothetical protein